MQQPLCAIQFILSDSVIESKACCTFSYVLAFNLDHIISIGLKSGEYGGKNNTVNSHPHAKLFVFFLLHFNNHALSDFIFQAAYTLSIYCGRKIYCAFHPCSAVPHIKFHANENLCRESCRTYGKNPSR